MQAMERRVMLTAATLGVVPQLAVDVRPLHESRGQDPQGIWIGLTGVTPIGPQLAGAAETFFSIDSYSPFSINESNLRQTLSGAPMEFTAAAHNDPLVFGLPGPDGRLQRFDVVESPIMEPGLAAKFPDIKTYSGVGIDDPHASLRMDVTMLGFHAQVLSPNGAYYVDPYWHLQKSAYVSYFKRDMTPTAADQSFRFMDAVDPIGTSPTTPDATIDASPFGTTLRTFRAAVAADGEYTAFWGGTVAAGQAAVVSAMNRVNGVYETELDIRMTLVANNSSVIYTDPTTDPYTNGTNDIDANTPNLNSVIGVNNYDVGHVFTTGSGGVSYLGVVGGPRFKGGSTTRQPTPPPHPF
jgi:hypothetical protein